MKSESENATAKFVHALLRFLSESMVLAAFIYAGWVVVAVPVLHWPSLSFWQVWFAMNAISAVSWAVLGKRHPGGRDE